MLGPWKGSGRVLFKAVDMVNRIDGDLQILRHFRSGEKEW